MGKFSRDKGKRGERAFVSLCKQEGYSVHRTAQYKGKTSDAGDVEGLPGMHVECKNVERLNLWDAMAQSRRDAEAEGSGSLPIVAHTKNNHGRLVTMEAADWFRIYREWEAGRDGTD